jgi:TatD DNase family protein
MGLYVSFAGPVTYPNAHVLQKVAGNIPDDRFFIETDCPYLSPQFMRGKRNEPSYIKAIAKKMAELRHTMFPEISRISTENAKRFFKIL